MPTAISPKLASPDLHAISYEQVKPGKPPIPITTAPRPSSAQANLHPSLRPSSNTSPQQPSSEASSAASIDHGEVKRDSGYTVTTPNARDSHTTLTPDSESFKNSPIARKSQSIRKSQSLPRFNGSNRRSPLSIKKSRKFGDAKQSQPDLKEPAPKLPDPTFIPKNPEIPTISFEDLTIPDKVQFSKRGSLLIGGRRASEMSGQQPSIRVSSAPNVQPRKDTVSAISTASRRPHRALTEDEEAASQKVRSMYDNGTDSESVVASEGRSIDARQGIEEEVIEEEPATPNGTLLAPGDALQRPASSATARRVSFLREQDELAGGIEDWQDVDATEVDRYGFIIPKSTINASSSSLPTAPDPQLHRVSTALQIASEAPRRSRSRLGRVPSASHSTRSASGTISASTLQRPVSSQSSYSSTRSISRMRSATNRLPHNRNRRTMDQAGDMLTLPSTLSDPSPPTSSNPAEPSSALRKKEYAREEKWRKMAIASQPHGPGGNTVYTFNTSDPKLISRTWKGIPDRWRATAWHSFLTTSAQKQPHFIPDTELITCFNELVDQSSPDDFQIDIDVPRTINSHIMFRRRYRGGQRLLFRVLHALSLYFSQTGYVQGMAALAATFLCYFDESMAFVMLVRLWECRGLGRLYRQGFLGLMRALEEFEKGWLAGGNISAKLNDLGITPTAYGTRWYLTMFNYSIPFPAQLRVWDVFLLLGDPDPSSLSSSLSRNPAPNKNPPQPSQLPPPTGPSTTANGNVSPNPATKTENEDVNGAPKAAGREKVVGEKADTEAEGEEDNEASFHGSLDVLHATAAALIDGMREILEEADFELAMKTLTSWVPIRDEDVLMRVAGAEWKVGRRKRKS